MEVREAAALLREQDNILIITHARPDGDTIGCAAGLCAALRQLGKTAFIHKNPDANRKNGQYASPYWAEADFSPSFVVTVDIAARQLFYKEAVPYLERGIDLAIDHHPSQEFFAKETLLNHQRAACGEIVYELCCELGEMTREVALPLYVALATDTGCFVYANTTANTHKVAAALMETGIDYFAVNKLHFRTKSRKRFQIEGELMATMEFFDENRGVFMALPLSLVEKYQATEDDLDDLSSIVSLVEGVDCGIMLKEAAPNDWKISVRTGANRRVNASEVCKVLGGGGHAMAAGARTGGTLEEVKKKLLEAVWQTVS